MTKASCYEYYENMAKNNTISWDYLIRKMESDISEEFTYERFLNLIESKHTPDFTAMQCGNPGEGNLQQLPDNCSIVNKPAWVFNLTGCRALCAMNDDGYLVIHISGGINSSELESFADGHLLYIMHEDNIPALKDFKTILQLSWSSICIIKAIPGSGRQLRHVMFYDSQCILLRYGQ